MKKVTIMIPTFNQAQYFEQCVNSALAQDYPNLEIVISDDSTNDETEHLAHTLYGEDKRIKYFHNTPPLGRVGNYHKTLYERASGDYVLNLDGDDWLIDNYYISEAVAILDANENVVCITANIRVYDESQEKYLPKSKHNRTLNPIMKGTDYLYQKALGKVSFSHMASLFRKKQAMESGFYTKNIIFSDGESFFRLFCNYDVAFVPKLVGVWRMHIGNSSSESVNDFRELFAVEESIGQFYKGNTIGPLSTEQWVKLCKVRLVYAEFVRRLLKGNFFAALLLWGGLWRYDASLLLPALKFMIERIFSKLTRTNSGF